MYKITLWLEIHIKLATDNKIFCRCVNTQNFDITKPNTNICPTCTAQPWGLPVVNQQAVEIAIKLWQIFDATIDSNLRFDRKSYFYPDSPAWYQITQRNFPIITNWLMNVWLDNYQRSITIGIHEAHLENDTAKATHLGWKTMLDFNRAMTPLIEVVTNPDFHTPEEVIEFLKELQRIVKWNNIWYADLEKWQMRVDVNLSISKTDQLWTRVEIKNMNSFSAIRRAIQYEFDRQSSLLDQWQVVDQTTVWRDDVKGETYVMRSKEDSVDYRYFPEPDLPSTDISQLVINDQIIKPFDTIQKMVEQWFNKEYINTLIGLKEVLDYYTACTNAWCEPKLAAKRICWPMMSKFETNSIKFTLSEFIEFLVTITSKNIPDFQAKQIFEIYAEKWGDVNLVISQLWFDQVVSNNWDDLINWIISANQKVVDEYKWWKLSAIWFLLWQVMRQAWGKLDPNEAKKLLEEKLI